MPGSTQAVDVDVGRLGSRARPARTKPAASGPNGSSGSTPYDIAVLEPAGPSAPSTIGPCTSSVTTTKPMPGWAARPVDQRGKPLVELLAGQLLLLAPRT